jgi:hypothetical protein
MKKHIPFVIQGDFSKEFFESMGYKPFVPEPVEVCNNPVMPLKPVKLAYELNIIKDAPTDTNEVA